MKTIKFTHRAPMTMALDECLKNRRSGRNFDPTRDISDDILAAILYAACGKNGENGLRTCPSTRERRAVDVYAVRADGVWHYNDKEDAIELVKEGDFRAITTYGQDFVKDAPITFAIVYDEEKGKSPEGEKMPVVWAWADAALISENIYLACAALGVSGVTRAWFDPEKTRQELGFRPSETAFLMHSVGYLKD